MFSVITNKKTEKVFFWQLEMFDVCTTGDTAHIDTLFKLTRVWQQLVYHIYLCYVTRGAHIEHL